MEPEGTAVVAVARDPLEATIWVDALRDAGIEARSFERGSSAAFGGASLGGMASFPVVVAATALGDARNVIAGLGGAHALAPVPDREALRERQRRILVVAGVTVVAVLAVAMVARLVGG